MTDEVLERFWNKVQVSNYGCWNWVGASGGRYGRFNIGNQKMVQAHRFIYELKNGKIREGLVIDHLCKNIKCVNPEHLEAVTQKTNVLRSDSLTNINMKKTHCKRGHKFTKNNLIKADLKRGKRGCKKCLKIRELKIS